MSSNTIAALATAPGRGGVAVIRVSGPDAFLVAERLTGWCVGDATARRVAPQVRVCTICEGVRLETGDARGLETRDASAGEGEGVRLETGDARAGAGEGVRLETGDARGLETRDANQTIARSQISNQTIARSQISNQTITRSQISNRTIDRALVLAFRAPHSYTGEDAVEFQCHGGTVTPSRVLAACFAAGATAARRGEFTERAFLNGKMDLSAAESVIELVDAKTPRAADDALARQAGAKRATYRALYEKALALSAELEHALDVDEEELPDDFLFARAARAAALADEARRLAGSADAGRLLRDGALVVLAGPPNAGKSSLLNALCGEDRAIVSPTPGTTRDTIEAWIDLNGWPVRLVDTAGLRETGDAIEQEGVRRAEGLLKKADVVVALDCEVGEVGEVGEETAHFVEMRPRVLCVHAKCDLDMPNTRAHFAEMRPRVLRVHAKCDLDMPNTRAHFGEKCDSPCGRISPKCALRVSAKTGEGLDALRAAIAARLAERAGDVSEDGATASERERAILLAAARELSPGDAAARRVGGEGVRRETGDARGLETRDAGEGAGEGVRLEAGDARGLETRDARLRNQTISNLKSNNCPTSNLTSNNCPISNLKSNTSPDPVLLANSVRSAAGTLGTLIGATYSSDLLDALFSRFCVGK